MSGFFERVDSGDPAAIVVMLLLTAAVGVAVYVLSYFDQRRRGGR